MTKPVMVPSLPQLYEQLKADLLAATRETIKEVGPFPRRIEAALGPRVVWGWK